MPDRVSISVTAICASVAAATLVSCAGLGGMSEVMPARNEEYSYQGPGGNYVLKGKFPPVIFSADSAALTDAEARKLGSLAAYVAEAAADEKPTIILAGFARDPGTEEYNRMLGEQRAQAVRAELIALGVDPDLITTVSYGQESGSRFSSGDDGGRRVEIGIVD
jgi:outer membrane protein OmpA-like peptidoglycan-associated protein